MGLSPSFILCLPDVVSQVMGNFYIRWTIVCSHRQVIEIHRRRMRLHSIKIYGTWGLPELPQPELFPLLGELTKNLPLFRNLPYARKSVGPEQHFLFWKINYIINAKASPPPLHCLVVRPCQNSNLCYFYVASLLDTKQADMKPRAVQYTYCIYCKYVALRCTDCMLQSPKRSSEKVKTCKATEGVPHVVSDYFVVVFLTHIVLKPVSRYYKWWFYV